MKLPTWLWPWRERPSVSVDVTIDTLTFRGMLVASRGEGTTYFVHNETVSMVISSTVPLNLGDVIDVNLHDLGFCGQVDA